MWVHYEHRRLSFELAAHDIAGARALEGQLASGAREYWHFRWSGGRGPAGWIDAPQPSSRLALMLAADG